MPSDSGHSIEDSTYETQERLPALDGDTPDPLQGLMPIGTLVESADTTISPITPLPDPITPLPEVEDEEEIGDTPNPAHGLPSLRTLPELFLLQEDEEEVGNTLDPAQGLQLMEGRLQGSPLLYTDTSVLQMYAPHSTLLVDALRKQRLRKIALRRYSRNQLRAARTKERRA